MLAKAVVSIFLINFISALGAPTEEDAECRPPFHHKKHGADKCCAVPSALEGKDDFHEVMHKCLEENGIKKHHHHHGDHPPPPPEDGHPPPPPPFNKTAFQCVEQCMLKAWDLLSEEGELKTDDVKAWVAKTYTDDWATVGTDAINKCLEAKEDESAKCKAGSTFLIKCFQRETFLNCPASHWTESEECTGFKERLTKCPNMPPPFPHHKH